MFKNIQIIFKMDTTQPETQIENNEENEVTQIITQEEVQPEVKNEPTPQPEQEPEVVNLEVDNEYWVTIQNHIFNYFLFKKEESFEIYINNVIMLCENKELINQIFGTLLTIASVNLSKITTNRQYLDVLLTLGRPTSISIRSLDALILSQILIKQSQFEGEIQYTFEFPLPTRELEWLKTDEEISKLINGESCSYFDVSEEKQRLARKICNLSLRS